MTLHPIPSAFSYSCEENFIFIYLFFILILFISAASLFARILKNIDAAYFSFKRELKFMDWWRFLFLSYQRWSDLPVTTVFNNSNFLLIGSVSYFFIIRDGLIYQ